MKIKGSLLISTPTVMALLSPFLVQNLSESRDL